MTKKNFNKSLKQFERAEKVIPLASQTFSKCHTQFSKGGAPLFLEKGEGAYVWDVDDNKYLDLIMALCPVLLGYQYEPIKEAVKRQLNKAVSLSLPSPLEAELAEKLIDIIPSAEMVRFGKNGSDATAGAVRAARAITGREMIAQCGYHGWQDWYVGTTTRDKGVPQGTKELTKSFKYNELESLEKIFSDFPNQIAAVIMEPVGVIMPEPGFLEKVKELTKQNGSLLIFDEIVTGFRLSLGGAQEKFGVIPDLSCFGKSAANGYPFSFVCGKKELMKEFEEIFFSFTFGGELLSMAAALAGLDILVKEPVIEQINKIGLDLQNGLNEIFENSGVGESVKAIGYGSRHVVQFTGKDDEESLTIKTIFQEVLAEEGILFGGSNNISYSHTPDDVKKVLAASQKAIEAIKKGEPIKGTRLQPVFRKA